MITREDAPFDENSIMKFGANVENLTCMIFMLNHYFLLLDAIDSHVEDVYETLDHECYGSEIIERKSFKEICALAKECETWGTNVW